MKVYFDPQIFLLQRYGGISKYFQNLIKSFVENPNLEIDPLFCSSPTENSQLISSLMNSDFGLSKNHFSKIAIMQLINSKDIPVFDLIHFTYYLPSRILYNKSLKSVSTIHDFIPESLYSKSNPNRYMHYAKLSYIKNSDGLIFVSEDSRAKFLNFYPSTPLSKNQVIHHGVSSGKTESLTKLENEKPYFLYVGSRSKYKNFEKLLKAFAKLPRSVNLLCFGGGAFTKNEIRLIRDLSLESVLHHAGSDDRYLDELYFSALAFVNPSLQEGFGMSNLEALSNGTIVLCSEIPIFKEILKNNAFYFNPHDTDSIYHQMFKVLNNPLNRFQRNMLIEHSKRFSWVKTATDTSDFYKSLFY